MVVHQPLSVKRLLSSPYPSCMLSFRPQHFKEVCLNFVLSAMSCTRGVAKLEAIPSHRAFKRIVFGGALKERRNGHMEKLLSKHTTMDSNGVGQLKGWAQAFSCFGRGKMDTPKHHLDNNFSLDDPSPARLWCSLICGLLRDPALFCEGVHLQMLCFQGTVRESEHISEYLQRG